MAKVNLKGDDFIDEGNLIATVSKIEEAIKTLDSNMTTFAKNLDTRLAKNTATIDNAKKAITDYQAAVDNIIPSSKNYTDTISKATEEINKQANAYVKANEETKKAKKATDDLDTSLNGIKAKYKGIIDEANKLDANSDAFKNLQDEAAKLDKEIKNLNQGFKAQRVVAEAAAGSYDELSQRQTKLKRDLKSLGGAFGANAAEAQRMKLEIQANDKTLKEFDTTIGESFRNVGNYASAFDKFGGGFSEGLLGAFSVGGAAGLGFTAVNKGIELVVEGISQGIETIKEINKEITKTSQLTDLTGQALQDATASIRSISQTFGQDFEKTLLVQNSLVKTFGLSFEEVGNIMSIAFANGGDASGDLLDQLQEYDVFFKQAGFSAQEFASILTSATKQGVFSDKAADLVKEFDLRINEQTKSTKDALVGAFGNDFTNKLFKGINDGSITTKEALLTVTEQINKTGIAGAKLGAIQADVFGGPGEDVGKDFLKSLPDTIRFAEKMSGTTKDLTLYLKEYGNTLNDNQKSIIKNKIAEDEYIKSQIELAARFSGISTDLSIAFTKSKTVILDYVNDLFDSFKSIGLSIEKFLSLFGTETSGKILDFFGNLLSFPFTTYAGYVDIVAQSFKQLVATVFGVSNAIKIFKIEFADNFQAIKDFASGEISFDTLKKNIKSQGEGVANAFKVGYEKTLAELNLASAAPVDSGDAGTPTNKAKNDKANESLAQTADKLKTIAQLRKELVKLNKELKTELAKEDELQSPKYLEEKRNKIAEINKLLAERKTINPNFELNDQVQNVNLDGNAKDKLVELGVLAEEYRQKELQGLITKQALELALFDVEKQRIEYQLANAAALNLNEEQIAKLKTEQIRLNQEIAANPIIESLRIINGQEAVLREQKAKGQISDYDFELRMLEIKKKAIDLEIANADKTKKSVEEINALKATQAEIDREIATKPLNTPIANAGKEALLSYIEDAAAAASAAAFLSSLQKGESVTVAVKAAGEAFVAAKIISTFSKKKFAKGVIDLEGPGTATSDSIPSLLSRGESVITARGTDNAKHALTQINMGKLTDADIFGVTKAENIKLTTAQAKQDSYSISKNDFAEMLQTVKKATLDSVNVTNVSIETMQNYLVLVQQSQRQTVREIYPDPTKPKTKFKNSAL